MFQGPLALENHLCESRFTMPSKFTGCAVGTAIRIVFFTKTSSDEFCFREWNGEVVYVRVESNPAKPIKKSWTRNLKDTGRVNGVYGLPWHIMDSAIIPVTSIETPSFESVVSNRAGLKEYGACRSESRTSVHRQSARREFSRSNRYQERRI